MFLARADSLANIHWIQRYNYGIAAAIEDCVLLPDGGTLLLFMQSIGTTPFNQVYYAHAARFDSAGTMRWQHRYGNAFAGLQHAVACPDGSYALAGAYGRRTPQNRLVYNAWILYLTADGDTIRSRHWNSLNNIRNISDFKLTPDGGLLLAGLHVNGPAITPSTVDRGWLHKLDAQGNTQWDYEIVASNPSGTTIGSTMTWLQVLQNGDFLLRGTRNQAPAPNSTLGYLARWHPPGSGSTQPTPVWELQLSGNHSTAYHTAMAPDGSLTLSNSWADPNPPQYDHVWLRHYASQGLPYSPQAALCAIPPVPNAAFEQPTPDSLILHELGSPGPQYAQLLRWRWTLGDGTVVNRTTAAPLRHRYATVPPFGTPVTVTITNNLGCTATQTLYPWGGPLASQPARALAARTTLFPNPASGAQVTLRMAGLRPQGSVPAQLLDALGRELRHFTLSPRAGTAEATLDLHGLPAGVYLLRLLPAEGPVLKRLVKQ
ncbi:T9SS type A sorting domain-containing protein [Hymenobacter sp. ASUV-10]|uniref:T9SS type A sorting domain-containing protein n=1 Tax=Hymenobacter aranciens TaxID=3063996 RepID=A0ABT9BA46_9BACT|nr:T9SS type A sorting domain-containing protein [Hymenobacter sp. ASUV-10]MDO7874584.1 T9SS type A sorting domain-containing protein [Hymenobacter sp. ASUV-10]